LVILFLLAAGGAIRDRLGKELGAPTILFIGLVKKIVASDRGAYPEKHGRWRGFLDQFAVGSFGIQS
jgi:hypothetical protein